MASGRGLNGGKEGSKEKQKNESSKVYSRQTFNGLENGNKTTDSGLGNQSQMEFGINVEDGNLLPKRVLGVDSGDSSSEHRPVGYCELIRGNRERETGSLTMEYLVTIKLSTKSMREVRELRTKLKAELDSVRSLRKKIESKEGPKAGRGANSVGKLKRAHSEMESVGLPHTSKSLNQLSVSVAENDQGGSGSIEKEKLAPKLNKVKNIKENYQSSETKKLKSSGKKGQGEEAALSVGLQNFPNHFVKRCVSLLDRLMKHKLGWVFNKPVDPDALGLNDYFDIIKNPMDLDTVKSRLSENWYKSPKDFAEDVRLTFRNAMTYNPKGHDVHVMAETLLNLFEDKWVAIAVDYMRKVRPDVDHGDVLPTPNSKKAPPARMPPPEVSRDLGRPEPNTHEVDPNANAVNSASVKSATPRKPKGKEPNMREMTYGEKQKLSENLQSLPSEKLENVVQIIKKRNASLCQNDDEIEVDIDSVDTETLWELDRFVNSYKKSMSKINNRQGELPIPIPIPNQSKEAAVPTIEEKSPAPTSKDTETEAAVSQSQKGKKEDKGSGNSDLDSSLDGSDSQSSSGIGSDV